MSPALALLAPPVMCRVTELRPRSTPSEVEEFLTLWAAQPRYALALRTLTDEELALVAAGVPGGGAAARLPRPGSADAGAGQGPTAPAPQRLQGLAVCWGLDQVYFLELSGGLHT